MDKTTRVNVALLGATGSIGESTLGVLRQHVERFKLYAVAAHKNWQALLPIIQEFQPVVCAVKDADAAAHLREALSQQMPLTGSSTTRVEVGTDAITAIAALPAVDVVVAGISGFAGLPSTWAAVSAGKTVLLANKEALVASGELLLNKARETGARILPIDSEHNAVYQCAGSMNIEPSRVRKITLTASGGPFRTRPIDTFDSITVDEACKHPTWAMGRKISVDSATLMNKGLEVIEAALLFNRGGHDISVLIHPTSTVHALLEFVDSSVLAHLGPADMQVPIAHALADALGEPRLPIDTPPISLTALSILEFFEVDAKRFPALNLAYKALAEGQGACLVLNAANEVAVAAFLNGAIRFTDIVPIVASALQQSPCTNPQLMDEVFAFDEAARVVTQEILRTIVAARPLL